MKKLTSLIAVGIAAISLQSASAAIILTTQFDNTFDDALTAPFVGNATLSYSAGSPLADGVYAWNSFSDLSFTASFPDLGVTFTQEDLDSTDVYVAIVGSNFFFANPDPDTNSPYNGSADFVNGTYVFTNEPIDVVSLKSTFRGTAFSYPLYQVYSTDAVDPAYLGSYGTDRQLASLGGGGGNPTAVPEPGSWTTAAALVIGTGFARWRRRPKAAKA